MTDECWLTSFHEAAHLVAALKLGNVVAGARIYPNGGGLTRQGPPLGLNLREARGRRAIMAIAAPIACQREFGPAGLRGCATDGLTVRVLVQDYDLDEADIRSTARAIVENNLVLIRRLALQLFLRGEIDRAAFGRCCGACRCPLDAPRPRHRPGRAIRPRPLLRPLWRGRLAGCPMSGY